MSADTKNYSALVISSDQSIVEAIITNNTNSEQTFIARESVDEVVNDKSILESNSIVIYDIDNVVKDVEKAIDEAIKIKQTDPTQVLMMVGEKEALSDILKSSIQPLVYRAFNKPINANQLALAFKSAHVLHGELAEKQAAGEDIMSVGPSENRTTIDSLAAERKTNPAIYIGIAAVILAIIGAVFLTGGDDEQNTPITVDQSPTITEDGTVEDAGETVSRTNELNQLAANALLDGRYVLPKGDNALEYYDQVLAIDPYDTIAYEGRKQVAEALRTSYDVAVADAKFDDALQTITALRNIEPLNTDNDKLVDDLSSAIDAHVAKIQESGTAEEIAATTAILDKIGSQVAGSKSAAAALKAEQALIARIDKALEEGNITPPAKGNAYQLVSDALKANKISKANSEPRVKELSGQLLALANQNFETENIEETSKLSALVKRLNVDRPGLAVLTKKLKERETALAAAAQKEIQEAEQASEEELPEPQVATPEPPKIIPAKIISRAPPRYPSRALSRNIEGWVHVGFDLDAKGQPENVKVLESEPAGVFDSAAMKSVKKWRFSPARNQDTGLPVPSTNIATKVQFRLGD